MKRSLKYVGILLLIILLYLLFWPVPVDPQVWIPPHAPEMKGEFAVNERLKDMNRISVSSYGAGPEDIAIDSMGNIYTGLLDGKIMKFDRVGRKGSVLADTKGRPLGLQFDTLGNLIVADGEVGLISLSPEGEIKLLTDSFNGKKMGTGR